MHAKKASLIISPRTGENVSKLPDVLAILAAAGWKTDISLKEYGKHVMKLAQDASAEKSDLVIAYGGDGTLNQVVNGVMGAKGHRSAIGVMPGGTANVWAGEIGVPNDPVKAALALVNSEERKVDVGRVQVHSLTFPGEQPTLIGKKAAKKSFQKSVRHHFLLMAGLGIDAAIMSNVSKPLKYRVGPLAVGLSAAKELPAQHAFPIEIQAVGDHPDAPPLWKGEALQVVIGNTRRYARVATMTPDAYIDDGILDVCVITAGDPISTVQQLASLLMRLKPATTTAEYFHGAHLLLKVPATIPFQVDGSPVKLKDYLSKEDYERLEHVEDQDQVLVTYQVDALPHALEVTIPRSYDDELFKRSNSAQTHEEGRSPIKAEEVDEQGQTATQQHTEASEVRPESSLQKDESDKHKQQHEADLRQPLPEVAAALLKGGRKVRVIGKVADPAQKDTYIVAGTSRKSSTGEEMPVALVINDQTALYNREGQSAADRHAALQELLEGAEVVVTGKRSKRNVIHATHLVL